MNELLVVGGASLDVLHLADGRTVTAAGGAGLYTALAVHAAGARATLLAPRPEPMPEPLRPVAERLNWIGPTVTPDDLMRLEIAHHGGGRATLVSARWGAVAALGPDVLPADPAAFDFVHIAALGAARRQVEFARAARARGARRVSAGTYARAVYGETDAVRALLAMTDVFFMNENEANGLFGSMDQACARPGALLFITLGERGARVVGAGEAGVDLSGLPACEVDPTGAGDTFCGAVLAGLARGRAPAEAAQSAMSFAARVIESVGPAALLQISRTQP